MQFYERMGLKPHATHTHRSSLCDFEGSCVMYGKTSGIATTDLYCVGNGGGGGGWMVNEINGAC